MYLQTIYTNLLQPTLSDEKQKCKEFVECTCGCSINKESPRTSLILL